MNTGRPQSQSLPGLAVSEIAATTVYLLMHDTWDGEEVRGVYANREDAERAATSRTPNGSISQSLWAHRLGRCCSVMEWEVE
jgi:hypothetical protein